MSDSMMIDVAPAAGPPSGGNGLLGGLGLLVRRRMWRDRWLVVSSALIVALATVLALAGPELVSRTIDDGAADIQGEDEKADGQAGIEVTARIEPGTVDAALSAKVPRRGYVFYAAADAKVSHVLNLLASAPDRTLAIESGGASFDIVRAAADAASAIALPDDATIAELAKASGGALAMTYAPCVTPPPGMSCVPGGRAIVGDDVVFKYQPLWPALLAVSKVVSGDTLLVRAVFSALGVLACAGFAYELVRSRRVAIIAAVLFALSPFVWLQTASVLGYHPSLVLLLGTSMQRFFMPTKEPSQRRRHFSLSPPSHFQMWCLSPRSP